MNWARRIGLAMLVLAGLCAAPAAASYGEDPAPRGDWGAPAPDQTRYLNRSSGPVYDRADIIPEADERRIAARLREYNARAGRDLVVATVPGLEGASIESYASTLLNGEWIIDGARIDPGVLVLVAPNDRQMRIEVDGGLDRIVTTDVAGRIVRDELRPRFKQGDFAGGISASVDVLITRLQRDPPTDARASAREPDGRHLLEHTWWDWANLLTFFLLLAFAPPIYWWVRHFVHMKF